MHALGSSYGISQPNQYNGIKIVKSKSQPLDEETDFKVIKKLSEIAVFSSSTRGIMTDRSVEARKHVKRVLSFIDIDKLSSLRS